MRIVYVTETYPPEINGVALTAARTVAHLRERGHDVLLLRPAQAGERPGEGSAEWRTAGWPLPRYPQLRMGLAWPAGLARRFERARAELVHVATEGALGLAAVVTARRLGLATTSDFRTNFHSYCGSYGLGFLATAVRAYLRWFHNKTDLCFVPTEGLRVDLHEAGFERLQLVGRGVDHACFSPAHRDPALRQRWGCFGNEPVLLYVGRLAAEKRVELALKSFQAARRFEPRTRMVVVGDGPQRSALEHAFPEARFLGAQTGQALSAIYASADVFVFPSESETFGNVTLEALASGLPVVAFDRAAAAQWVSDGVNGRLVPAGDEAGFINATCLMAAVHHAARGPDASLAARHSVAGAGWEPALGQFERCLLQAAEDAQATRFSTARAA